MRLKKLAATLTITAILFSFIQTNMKLAFSDNTNGKIDLFTQKEPYSGKGPNMPSDAFRLGEIVILYSLVTYSDIPLENLLVTFCVQSPDNGFFSLTAETNASGVATINFTIPQKCVNESEIFGEWVALANVLVEDYVFQDSLTFEVDWIVKLISARTIDENLTHRTSFGIGGDVGLEITLRSIAITMKRATLTIVIKDELNVPINYSEIRGFDVQPNEKIVFLYCRLSIPKWSHVGKATVLVSALTAPVNESGVPYCPTVSTDFTITPYDPLRVAFHDVAIIDASPSVRSVEVGQRVGVNALVRNEGTEIEGFNVSAYLNDMLIGTLQVVDLAPYFKATMNFTVETSTVGVGKYTVTVSIPCLVNEADLTDNIFVDGMIEIKPKTPTIVHDIAIVNVTISDNSLYIGELLQINVSVINKGTETETFDVRTYYDFVTVETLRVNALPPDTRTTLISVWNTSFVREGFYLISASAPLPLDVNVLDNVFVDGVVQVKARPSPPLIHDVAVLNVTPSSNFIYLGETLEINVTVKNEGDYVESFNVTVFYDSNVVGTLPVYSLLPNKNETLIFHWSTKDVSEGNYTISAFAIPVQDEEDTEDNYLEDGVVEVVVAPTELFVPEWLLWLLALLLASIIILLIVWLYRRRKRKETREAFYSGWTAWYYCYDLRSKLRRGLE